MIRIQPHQKEPSLLEPTNKIQKQGMGSELDSGSLELRILLLGKHGAGKSATGNSILGKKVFESKFSEVPVTKICKKESGIVGKKEVVIIDTPDLFSRRRQSDRDREEEIRHCHKLCLPGPHILLLVTTLGHYTEEDREIVKGIQKTFGAEATRHVILLFTRKEELEDGSLEKHVEETDDECLKLLVQICGGRYCAFKNRVGGEEQNTQVQDLLKKIKILIKENGYWCYAEFNVTGEKQENTIDSKADLLSKLPDTQEKKKRMIRVQPHQKEPSLLDIISLILVGKSGTGKSSTGNTIIGEQNFEAKLAGRAVTKTCKNNNRFWNGKEIIVVDTPSFDLTNEAFNHEEEVLRSLCLSPGAKVFILVIQLGRFTEEDEKSITELEVIFGEEVIEYMIVVFTRKDDLGTETLKNYLETSNNKSLKNLIKRCGGRCCAFNNKERGPAQEEQVNELLEMVQQLLWRHGGRGYPVNDDFQTFIQRIKDFQKKSLFSRIGKWMRENVA